MKLRFLKRAMKQLELQYDWWEENVGSAQRLEAEVEHWLLQLKAMPYIGAPVENARPGTRQVVLKTQHLLYYRVNEKAGFIEVLRVWHSSRGRKPKL